MDYLDLLKHNGTFSNPEEWVEYAQQHGFKAVCGTTLKRCPDCQSEGGAVFGQYIHYSNLIRLINCDSCGLIYSDVHLPLDVISKHFESAYKDEQYFLEQRAPIFEQIVELVSAHSKPGARVIDIGGAKGHLLNAVAKKRADLSLVLNDLSVSACDYAKSNFGLSVLPGSISELIASKEKYDVILLIDVIYYEPQLGQMWNVIEHLRAKGGTLIFRVPNHLQIMKWNNLIRTICGDKSKKQTKVKGLNPEHIYIFSREYLENKLRSIGCSNVQTIPSRLLGEGDKRSAKSLLFKSASIVQQFIPTGPVITPSMFVIGSGD